MSLATLLTPARQRRYFRTVGSDQGVESPLVTVPQACAMLRISRWTFYTKFVHTKRLSTIKIGTRRLVPVAAIHRLVEELASEAGV